MIGRFIEKFQNTPPEMLAMYGAAVAVLILALWLSRLYWRSKITKWAQAEGLKLIDYRGARFWEGPSKFVRSRNQHAFRVEVEDRNGIRRTAWLLYGTFWGFSWGVPLTQVVWSNDDEI